MIRLLFSGISLIPLVACTATAGEKEIPQKGATPGYVCNANDLQALIGEQANENTGELALKRSKAKKLRWIPPNSAITMDYRMDRLNISYNEEMAITKVNCG